jgi:FkbM family methyltransferase
MDKSLARNVITFALTICVVQSFGCGDENDTSDAGGDVLIGTPDAPSPDKTQEKRNADRINAVIGEHLAKLRNAKGRDGILAEERRYSLFDEELIIRDFFQDRRGGVFLDVGCAWPVKANNTYYLEKHLGWTGIGIDALEDYGPGWKEIRSESRFFSYLVTDESGVMQTFFKSPNTGLSSTRRDMASGKAFGADFEPEVIVIETITLNDLLDREGVRRIDLLAMDIEGNEPKALAGFDIDRFQPALVVIERSLDPASEGKNEVHRYFERHGYEVIEKYKSFDPVNLYFRKHIDEAEASKER